MVGITCLPPIGIGSTYLPKSGGGVNCPPAPLLRRPCSLVLIMEYYVIRYSCWIMEWKWNHHESCFLALPIKVIPIFRSKKISFLINHDYNPEPLIILSSKCVKIFVKQKCLGRYNVGCILLLIMSLSKKLVILGAMGLESVVCENHESFFFLARPIKVHRVLA